MGYTKQLLISNSNSPTVNSGVQALPAFIPLAAQYCPQERSAGSGALCSRHIDAQALQGGKVDDEYGGSYMNMNGGCMERLCLSLALMHVHLPA